MELVERCQIGDPNSFALLFEQYKNLVFRTALLMLNDREEAEDALQEIFLRVHRSIKAYRSEKGAFTTWLYRITVNYCLNLKRKHRFNLTSLHSASNSVRRMQHPSPEGSFDQAEIRSYIQKLTPKLRAVIVLHFYWDLTYAEMSQILEIPIGTVKSRMNQALKNIRKAINLYSVENLVISTDKETYL